MVALDGQVDKTVGDDQYAVSVIPVNSINRKRQR